MNGRTYPRGRTGAPVKNNNYRVNVYDDKVGWKNIGNPKRQDQAMRMVPEGSKYRIYSSDGAVARSNVDQSNQPRFKKSFLTRKQMLAPTYNVKGGKYAQRRAKFAFWRKKR